jgi:nicotinamide mononucleotide adenylyltransferase
MEQNVIFPTVKKTGKYYYGEFAVTVLLWAARNGGGELSYSQARSFVRRVAGVSLSDINTEEVMISLVASSQPPMYEEVSRLWAKAVRKKAKKESKFQPMLSALSSEEIEDLMNAIKRERATRPKKL